MMIAPEITEASRRKFLKQTFMGLIMLSAGGIRGAGRWPWQPEAPANVDLVFFSPHEYSIVQAIARRIIGMPGNGGVDHSEIDVALRADRFLAGADAEIQEQFHQLLVVFNAAFFAFLFDFRLSSFLTMPPAEQDLYLEDWMTSNLDFRRTAFQALKRLCTSLYYTDERSWEEISYTGLFLPQDRQ